MCKKKSVYADGIGFTNDFRTINRLFRSSYLNLMLGNLINNCILYLECFSLMHTNPYSVKCLFLFRFFIGAVTAQVYVICKVVCANDVLCCNQRMYKTHFHNFNGENIIFSDGFNVAHVLYSLSHTDTHMQFGFWKWVISSSHRQEILDDTNDNI